MKFVLNVEYEIVSQRNVFLRHYAEMKCVFCSTKIMQFISMGLDKDPAFIPFESTGMQAHFLNSHGNEVVGIHSATTDINKQICTFIVEKKIDSA